MQKVSFQNNRKQKLSGILCGTDNGNIPCIIVCHGLGGSKDNKQYIMEEFEKIGIASLAFDFHGHGESEGNFEMLTITNTIDDVKAAIDFVSSLDFIDKNRIGIMGHSFGGSVSIIAASTDNRIKAVVVSAPVSDFFETMKMLSDFDTRLGNTNVWKDKGFTFYYSSTQQKYMKLNYSFFEDVMKHDLKNIAKKIKCPVMIIHGNKDRIVPLKQSETTVNLLTTQKELKVLECGHLFEEKDIESLINFSKEWFLKWLG